MKISGKIYDLDLPQRAIRVYCYLCRKADRNGVCSPLVDAIADDLHISGRTVFRALNDLEAAAMLRRTGRYRVGGGRHSNLYRIGGDVHGLD